MKNKRVTKKRTFSWLDKHIVQPRVIAQHGAKHLKHWTHFLVSSEGFEIPINCLGEGLKVLATCFETNTQLSFLVTGEHWKLLKIWSVKSRHTRLLTSNKKLKLLAELHISTFYFEILENVTKILYVTISYTCPCFLKWFFEYQNIFCCFIQRWFPNHFIRPININQQLFINVLYYSSN